MLLRQAIKESDLRAAALYLEQSRSLYVVAQYGPFTFPGNFIDVKYTTEIHRYDRDGSLDYAIISFSPINWVQLGLSLGSYINDDNWFSYRSGGAYSPDEITNFKRRNTGRPIKKLVNPRFRDAI